LVKPEIIIVDFWWEIESLASSPPKSFFSVEPMLMASSVIRYTIHPSEERLLVFFAQQVDGGTWMHVRKVAGEIRYRIRVS
jgi:hypothetical protein